ncbi:MAG: hypothetical protein HYR73_02645, partial [Candidatus Eisenbacteria bacterium]|nr:hypothetical protein [Candidatus Eisenbacteria bacterium]
MNAIAALDAAPSTPLAVLRVRGLAVLAYGLVQTLIVVYASHRWVILWRWWRHRRGKPGATRLHA